MEKKVPTVYTIMVSLSTSHAISGLYCARGFASHSLPARARTHRRRRRRETPWARCSSPPSPDTSSSSPSLGPPSVSSRRSMILSLASLSVFLSPYPSSAWVWDFSFGPQPKLMDAEFANTLIDAMTAVAGTTRVGEFQLRSSEIRAQKLPAYQSEEACGHCGQRKDPGAFRDPSFFDFETYVRGKALLQMNTGAEGDGTKRELYIRNANIAIGSYILRKILEERYTEDAERTGISPFFSVAAMRSEDNLLSASPDLESVRAGVKTLLDYFQRRGFVSKTGIAQCGTGEDEEETQRAWQGDGSATLVYWLVNPVDAGSSLRLQEEEGVYLGFISATIAAFLRRCGVRSSDVVRAKSSSVDGLVVEQSKLERIKPLESRTPTPSKDRWAGTPIPDSL